MPGESPKTSPDKSLEQFKSNLTAAMGVFKKAKAAAKQIKESKKPPAKKAEALRGINLILEEQVVKPLEASRPFAAQNSKWAKDLETLIGIMQKRIDNNETLAEKYEKEAKLAAQPPKYNTHSLKGKALTVTTPEGAETKYKIDTTACPEVSLGVGKIVDENGSPVEGYLEFKVKGKDATMNLSFPDKDTANPKKDFGLPWTEGKGPTAKAEKDMEYLKQNYSIEVDPATRTIRVKKLKATASQPVTVLSEKATNLLKPSEEQLRKRWRAILSGRQYAGDAGETWEAMRIGGELEAPAHYHDAIARRATNAITHMTPQLAKIIAEEHPATKLLCLDGLVELTGPVARELVNTKCRTITMLGLKSLDDEAARALAEFKLRKESISDNHGSSSGFSNKTLIMPNLDEKSKDRFSAQLAKVQTEKEKESPEKLEKAKAITQKIAKELKELSEKFPGIEIRMYEYGDNINLDVNIGSSFPGVEIEINYLYDVVKTSWNREEMIRFLNTGQETTYTVQKDEQLAKKLAEIERTNFKSLEDLQARLPDLFEKYCAEIKKAKEQVEKEEEEKEKKLKATQESVKKVAEEMDQTIKGKNIRGVFYRDGNTGFEIQNELQTSFLNVNVDPETGEIGTEWDIMEIYDDGADNPRFMPKEAKKIEQTKFNSLEELKIKLPGLVKQYVKTEDLYWHNREKRRSEIKQILKPRMQALAKEAFPDGTDLEFEVDGSDFSDDPEDPNKDSMAFRASLNGQVKGYVYLRVGESHLIGVVRLLPPKTKDGDLVREEIPGETTAEKLQNLEKALEQTRTGLEHPAVQALTKINEQLKGTEHGLQLDLQKTKILTAIHPDLSKRTAPWSVEIRNKIGKLAGYAFINPKTFEIEELQNKNHIPVKKGEEAPTTKDLFREFGVYLEYEKMIGEEGALQKLDEKRLNEMDFERAKEIAKVAFKESNFNQSVQQCKVALEIHPDDIGVMEIMGDAYYKQEKYSSAATQYEEIIKLDPSKKDRFRPALREIYEKEMLDTFRKMKYDFRGVDDSEEKSQRSFAREIIWLCESHHVSPLDIKWHEIFDQGDDIKYLGQNWSGEDVDYFEEVVTFPLTNKAHEFAKDNMEVIQKVEQWISDNLKK